MTKNDLMTGMRVTLRNGTTRLVMRNTPYGDGYTDVDVRKWGSFDKLNNDLTDRNDNAFDIMKVETPHNAFRVLGGGKSDDYDVVWTRRDTRRVTMDELREILGGDFVIA